MVPWCGTGSPSLLLTVPMHPMPLTNSSPMRCVIIIKSLERAGSTDGFIIKLSFIYTLKTMPKFGSWSIIPICSLPMTSWRRAYLLLILSLVFCPKRSGRFMVSPQLDVYLPSFCLKKRPPQYF